MFTVLMLLDQSHKQKGSDWIRLVFAHLFPLNSGAPIASANFNSDGNVQVFTIMIELAQLMGAPLFKTDGLAQSSPYPVSPFKHFYLLTISDILKVILQHMTQPMFNFHLPAWECILLQ